MLSAITICSIATFLFFRPSNHVDCSSVHQMRHPIYCFSNVPVIVFGAITIGLSFVASSFTSKIVQATSTIWGVIGGPLAGVFIMGFYMPFCNSTVSKNLISLHLNTPVCFNTHIIHRNRQIGEADKNTIMSGTCDEGNRTEFLNHCIRSAFYDITNS